MHGLAARTPRRSLRCAARRLLQSPAAWALVAISSLLAGCDDEDPRVRPLPFDPVTCLPLREAPVFDAERASCRFRAGDPVSTTLGLRPRDLSRIPITHVIIRMQENRSFDHYLGQLARRGHPEVDGFPLEFANPNSNGDAVTVFPLASTCLEADPPHQWEAMNAQYAGGALDGFVTTAAVAGSDGRYTMGYYDEADLPFYYWAARTFAISDRYFSSSLGGTWSNRNFLYTGSAHGVKSTFDDVIDAFPSLFDQLDAAGVEWGIYTDFGPRQDTIGFNGATPGVYPVAELIAGLESGFLPRVVFVDTPPFGENDEHPPLDVQAGERWTQRIYDAAVASPLWSRLAVS